MALTKQYLEGWSRCSCRQKRSNCRCASLNERKDQLSRQKGNGWQLYHLQIEQGKRRVQDDLQYRVDGHEDGAELRMTIGKLVPDQHHCNTTSQPHHDDSCICRRTVSQIEFLCNGGCTWSRQMWQLKPQPGFLFSAWIAKLMTTPHMSEKICHP